jgi:hypothetical protein
MRSSAWRNSRTQELAKRVPFANEANEIALGNIPF